jgi:hypothetical protein
MRNHAPDIAAMDLFMVPTIGFKLLQTRDLRKHFGGVRAVNGVDVTFARRTTFESPGRTPIPIDPQHRARSIPSEREVPEPPQLRSSPPLGMPLVLPPVICRASLPESPTHGTWCAPTRACCGLGPAGREGAFRRRACRSTFRCIARACSSGLSLCIGVNSLEHAVRIHEDSQSLIGSELYFE